MVLAERNGQVTFRNAFHDFSGLIFPHQVSIGYKLFVFSCRVQRRRRKSTCSKFSSSAIWGWAKPASSSATYTNSSLFTTERQYPLKKILTCYNSCSALICTSKNWTLHFLLVKPRSNGCNMCWRNVCLRPFGQGISKCSWIDFPHISIIYWRIVSAYLRISFEGSTEKHKLFSLKPDTVDRHCRSN